MNVWKYALENAMKHIMPILRESDLGKKIPEDEWCDWYNDILRQLYFEDFQVYLQLEALQLAMEHGETRAEEPYRQIACWFGNEFAKKYLN